MANPEYPHETYVQNRIRVQGARISEWARKTGVTSADVIWMDVQGAALGALRRFGDLLSSVKMIYNELFVRGELVGR